MNIYKGNIEEITLKDLRVYLFYSTNISVLKHKFCPRGSCFLLRKSHLAKDFGTNFGPDVLIVNPEDFPETW